MKNSRIVAAIGLVLLVALGYANSFPGSFHFDDSHTILENLAIRNILNVPHFFTDSSTFSALPSNQSYRPLLTATFAFDYWVSGGLNAWAFQLTSVLVLVAHIPFLLLLFKKLNFLSDREAGERFSLAWVATAFFVMHTVLAETVNYPSARSDALSTLFLLIALTVYACLPTLRRYQLHLIPAFLAVTAKEQAAVYPVLLAGYLVLFEYRDLWKLPLNNKFKRVVSFIFNLAPAALVSGFGFWLTQHMAPQWVTGGSSRWDYAVTQLWVVLSYQIKFLFPLNLSADTDWTLITYYGDERVIAGFLTLLGVAYYWFSRLNSLAHAPILFGLFWFYVALAPTSSFVALAEVTNDHRMFFPFVGLSLAAAHLFYGLFKQLQQSETLKPRILCALTVLVVTSILGGHLCGLYSRNKVWKDDQALWYDVTVKSPKNARGLMNYGLTLMATGKYPEAETYFLRALELWPRYSTLYINLAILQGATNRPADAEASFKKARELNPAAPSSHYYYARWLHGVGRSLEAVPLLEIARKISANDVNTNQLLIEVYLSLQRLSEAKTVAEQLRKMDPVNEIAARVLAQQ